MRTRGGWKFQPSNHIHSLITSPHSEAIEGSPAVSHLITIQKTHLGNGDKDQIFIFYYIRVALYSEKSSGSHDNRETSNFSRWPISCTQPYLPWFLPLAMVQAGPPCRFLPASAPLPHLPTLSLNWSISRHYLFRMWGTSEMSWFKPFTDEELVTQRSDDTVPDYRLWSLTSREIIHNLISEFLVTSTWDNKLQVNKLMYTCKSRNHKAKRLTWLYQMKNLCSMKDTIKLIHITKKIFSTFIVDHRSISRTSENQEK